MSVSSNRKNYLIYIIIFFGITNYIIAISQNLFFKKKQYNPVNYNILDTINDSKVQNNSKLDFISLASEMLSIFDQHNFSRETFLNKSYYSLIVFSSLPQDFLSVQPIKFRKELFVKTILPILFLQNERILIERKKILEWWTETEGELIDREFWPDWLKEISNNYFYKDGNIGDLLMSVDIVPVSLAISQAVIESGWGTSRYAREGNAIFGQYTYAEDKGIVPEKRDIDKTFLVRKFETISESVESYFKNLNTHQAYEKFREARKEFRMNGEKLDGNLLVDTLIKYSERRDLYIKDIKTIMIENKFHEFDEIYNSSLIN